MESKLIEIGGKVFLFKIGLKGLIYLSKYTNLDEDQNFYDILYAGLMAEQPDITREEIVELVSPEDIPRIKAAFQFTIPSNQTIEGWLRKGLGEIGLPLDTLYRMTPYELDVAYEGYLQRTELQANLIKLAICQANNHNTNTIQVAQSKGYSIGSLKEREETFKLLGIKEENNGI